MATHSSLSDFKEYELIPRLYDRIDKAFPELCFKKGRGGWVSKYHLDGTRDSQNKDISFVYGNRKFMAIDHSAEEKKGLVDLYMSLNGKDFITALKELADLCGLSVPAFDSEEWREYEKRLAGREKDNKVFIKALKGDSEEAKRVRSYLNGRGWTDEEIEKAELGLVTLPMLDFLEEEGSYRVVVKDGEGKIIGGVGTTHLLTIPYRNGSRLLGFKFREVVDTSTGTKYLNSYGLQKSTGLFGMGIGAKDLVIVEGELDALHAQVKGANNVVATTGGKASDTQIEDAVKRGVERFTLLFDNDERGRGFIRPTIDAIQRTGKSIFVASLPDGYKDTDEYLKEHSIGEFSKVIERAVPYSHYILFDLAKKYSDLGEYERENGPTLKDREDFFKDVERLLNSPYIKPYEREDIYKGLEAYEKDLNFKVSDFRAWADKDYLRKQEASRARAVSDASGKIAEAVRAGRIDEALTLMRRTASGLSAQERAVEFANTFAPSSPQEYAKLLSEIKEGVPTGFVFEQGRQMEEFTLNSGLTFICGYRGHGKTSFLNNIALNEAKRNVALGTGKSVLYFSYEVDKRRLINDLLNTFVNDPDISRTPADSILSYFKGKGSTYFVNGYRRDGRTHYENFLEQKDKFFNEILSSGALTVVDENYRVEKLLEGIKYYLSTRQTSIVCIDYAQLIYSEESSRQRTEEIKKVVNDIKDFANAEGIPFVLAAQFNREVDSPVSVDTKNIGEGGDFERIADTCIGLFNLKELHPLPKNKDEDKAAKRLLADLGVMVYAPGEDLKPIPGKLFVRLMKRRYGYFPLDTVLEWEGRTKYIKPNYPEALSPRAGQGEPATEAAADFSGMDEEDDIL